jgi:hypothetical protein
VKDRDNGLDKWHACGGWEIIPNFVGISEVKREFYRHRYWNEDIRMDIYLLV